MNKYWFRKRRGLLSGDLGWGWVPISIEGWILTLGSVFWLFALFMGDATPRTNAYIYMIITVVVFVFIADMKSREKVLFK